MELSNILCEKCGAKGVCEDGMEVFIACLCQACFDTIWKEYVEIMTKLPKDEPVQQVAKVQATRNKAKAE